MATGSIEDQPRERRSLLKAYYGLESVPLERDNTEGEDIIPQEKESLVTSSSEKEVDFVAKDELQDPVDINGKYFVCKKYMDKLLSECNLNQLDVENTRLSQQELQLDSEIQTLVYENYNKFIAATDTIRQMRQDFKDMEEEMKKLENSMTRINTMSTEIDNTLSPHKATINKLASIHELLRKLQFLYDLPGRLKKCLEMGQHTLAVRYHLRALPILQRYKDTPAFTAIHDECNQIMQELTTKLHTLLRTKSPFSDESSESIELLLKLGEDKDKMIELFLIASRVEVDSHFERAIKPCKSIEEYVKIGCDGVLGVLQRITAKFRELFSIKREKPHVLNEFVHQYVEAYLTEAEKFLLEKVSASDPVVMVRSLDRLYKQVLTIARDKLIESLVSKIAISMIQLYQTQLEDHFNSLLQQMHTDLSRFDRSQFGSGKFPPLSTMHASLHDEFRAAFKANLIALKEFISGSIKFSQNAYFRAQFCVHGIRDGLVKKTFQFVLDTVETFPTTINLENCPELLLILSRLCIQLANSTISFLTSRADEMFQPELDEPLQASPVKNSLKRANKSASNLLNRYVYHCGDQLSRIFHVNLVSRDWIDLSEPTDVRDIIRRTVDDLSYADSMVGMLFDEGVKEESSEGSRKNYLQGAHTRKPFYGTQTSSLIGSINVSRLFSERMTYYNSVHFNKLSILTGIIKISLKAFLESVRYCTFGKYGLQQMQIDLAYLHVYIWRFVSNEDLVLDLLEDILTSTISRCVEPTMMDSSIVDVFCQEK